MSNVTKEIELTKKVSDLEGFIIGLLKDIEEASNKNENFDLHMEAPWVKEVAEEYKKAKWIEIY